MQNGLKSWFEDRTRASHVKLFIASAFSVLHMYKRSLRDKEQRNVFAELIAVSSTTITFKTDVSYHIFN